MTNSSPQSPRERLLMDPGWRFHLGEATLPPPINHGDTYNSVKAGWAQGAAGVSFDDSAWRTLDLPHDWLVEQPYDPAGNVSHGFRAGGVAWYRKRFDLPAEDLGRQLWLEFDGVFRSCKVWLNGHRIGDHRSGYTSFYFDISDVANYGGENVLAVRVDATDVEGWWYEGAGIYRHVWLTKTSPLHIGHWGTFVTATLDDETGAGWADIAIRTTVVNETDEQAICEIHCTVLDPGGQEAASGLFELGLPERMYFEAEQHVQLASPQLWDVDCPALYTLHTEIRMGDEVVDASDTPFGIRSFRFDADEGFFLNGRPLKLLGTCNHQDHAGVGVAVPDAVQEFRVSRLKDMGSNAYRTAHNPPAPELLDACDRLGLLVMDENRHLSSSTEGLSDLESMIRRDRNHPSVIMWSMANEEPLQETEAGARIVTAMNRRTRELDPTRPTTTAMNGGWAGAFSLAHDVQGCNYNPGAYDGYRAAHPGHPVLGSETSSALSTRGIYVTDPASGYLSAYDVNCPDWGNHAEEAWRAIADRPFMAGTFVWTGFDYRGEPQPYEWPCINSAFGIMDTCGFPKDNFYYYQAWWGGNTVLHLLPHWNWPERLGEAIPVWCHSNCDEVELFLNGESLGRKAMPRNGHLEWEVVYAPGALSATGYIDGEEAATAVVETTGAAEHLQLTPDREAIGADGEDVCVVTASVHDAEGRLVPTANDLIAFAVSDNASVLGVGNGDPSGHEPDKAEERHAFNGLCQVLVQSKRGAAGAIELTATAPGLKPAKVTIASAESAVRAFVAGK